ncbi:CheY-like chemotaxis protein [Filimonas zeae]|uniref:Response regulator n=1 Tax=Filimonas zeae TaxID=1737353 RepID=A0A917N061_9BACT|nr:response regulator [Filimonas zeae]MDR6342165.1 CheY-like chemotaxis protein [Filimonas zeae]GGH78852.1 response regulator [Filimonas zeae]
MEKSLRFAIIDDDQVYQLILKKTFEKSQPAHSLMQFYNGEEAIDFLKANTSNPVQSLPEILLLDINMPFMNGWQFLEALENLPIAGSYKPVIHIISSSPATEDIEMAGQYKRVSSYIVKPVTKEVLTGIISKAC